MSLLIYYPAVWTGYFSTSAYITLMLSLKKVHKLYYLKQENPRKCISKATIMFYMVST